MSFVHLHGHSTFSFLEAIGGVKDIVKYAKQLGLPAIAITDYHGVYGAITFYNAALAEGIKPIIGVELGFVIDHTSTIQADHIGNIVLLAQTAQGYQNMLELISLSQTQGYQHKPKIDVAMLRKHGEGIVVLLGGEQSVTGVMFRGDEKKEKIRSVCALILECVGKENMYGEIVAQRYTDIPLLQDINTMTRDIADELGYGCVVTNNYHYIHYEDKHVWELALAIKDGLKMYDTQRRKPKGEFFICEEKWIRDTLATNGFSPEDITMLLATTQEVADRIECKLELGKTLFPRYASPDDIQHLYDTHKDSLVEVL